MCVDLVYVFVVEQLFGGQVIEVAVVFEHVFVGEFFDLYVVDVFYVGCVV